jgi:hypothetical protein
MFVKGEGDLAFLLRVMQAACIQLNILFYN